MSTLENCGVLLCFCLLLCVVCPDGGATAEDHGRPLCPTEAGVRCQPDKSSGLREYVYSVDGERVIMEFTSGGYFSLRCSGNVTLESRSLPRFSAEQRVAAVTLQYCPPPAEPGSYATALARLNVTALVKLTLYNARVTLPFRRSHFAGSAHLTDLVVQVRAAPEPEVGFLAELEGLRNLRLDTLRLPAAELERLPTRLEDLHLIDLGVERVTAAVLTRLPLLRVLTVRDVIKVEIELNETSALRAVTLSAPGAGAPATRELQHATLWHWGAAEPGVWGPCDRLESLELVLPAAKTLPPKWISRCRLLSALMVSQAKLETVPARLLEGAAALREFNFTSCGLLSLPSGLFNDTPQLRTINISHNNLLTLPSELFSSMRKLVSLDLSDNKLSDAVAPALSYLSSLRVLALSGNPLGALCGGAGRAVEARGLSQLHALGGLRELGLARAAVPRVCSDWRASMPLLAALDLSDNNITHLMYDDLQFSRAVVGARVDLTGNPISVVQYFYDDYRRVRIERRDSEASVKLDSSLKCDCNMYWTALAMRERGRHVTVEGLMCGSVGEGGGGGGGGPVALVDVALSELVCPWSSGCPAGCRCASRPRPPPPRAPPAAAPGAVTRLRCEAAGRTALPPLPAPPASPASPALRAGGWELLLRNNSIRDLHLEDLPGDLLTLDLRDNAVSDVAAEVASRLLSSPTSRVLLAGNPLACECGAALAPALSAHRERVDYAALACGGPDAALAGRPLRAAPAPAECRRRAAVRLALALAGALLPLALAGAALAAWLLRPELRLRVKAALAARGWLPGGGGGGAEPERRYDAFVSYSHRDEAAVRELAARLERAGYRLCLHYRDWAPGEWIPAQIAASVRSSRRTIALVSEHFLASTWARAEFREAHAAALRAARPTLLVVLLAALPPRALDPHPDLRAFLATNTYVEWTDPWFWEKLLYAMPRLSRARPAPAADPAPPPAPAPPTAA